MGEDNSDKEQKTVDNIYDDVIESYRETAEYQAYNDAEKSIAECNFKIACSNPDYSAEIDPLKKLKRLEDDFQFRHSELIKSGTFLNLRDGAYNGKFNVDEAMVAADWLRENYTAGYDLNAVKQNAEKSLVLGGHTVDESDSNAVPFYGDNREVIAYLNKDEVEQAYLYAVRGTKQVVDAEATKMVIDAIERDDTLSSTDKNRLKLEEANNYCERTEKDYSTDHSESGIKCIIEENLLRYYPDLAQYFDKESVKRGLSQDYANAENVGKIIDMNPDMGISMVSKRVEEGAKNTGTDSSISDNAQKIEIRESVRTENTSDIKVPNAAENYGIASLKEISR